jgi:peptide-methionine (R)-S-oxide reductase
MDNDQVLDIKRRGFLTGFSGIAVGIGLTRSAHASSYPLGEDISFEVQRSDKKWRDMLTTHEYGILREGKTEKAKSSPLWNETHDGKYHCKGCGLTNYEGRWKTIIDKGWVFFFHAVPNAVLMGIDGDIPEFGAMTTGSEANTELHCRRCGSHLGHYVYIKDRKTHCINGASLVFKPKVT